VENDPSFTAFTDEGGGAELRQLDTTGVDAAKIQLELIEFHSTRFRGAKGARAQGPPPCSFV